MTDPGVRLDRAAIARAKRVIVKVGSKSLTDAAFVALSGQIAALHAAGKRVIVVSSGAIALGMVRLGLTARPKDMAWLQAAAAAGQSSLMHKWEAALSPFGLVAAQVLLTHADLADRNRTNNARAAMEALLEANAVPIINENDAVSVEEIKFGDNDQLASMVVPLVSADLLLLLSDVAGLLDDRGARVPVVSDIEREARRFVTTERSSVGTGGMISKVEAARRATLAGAHVVIAEARRDDVIVDITRGADVGTWFPGIARRISARKHWIAFTLRPKGAVLLDRGAASAVVEKQRTVLTVGVLGVRGTFQSGDAVSLLDPDGREIGRGLVRASATDAARWAGGRGVDGESFELVHRDDLVVLVDPPTADAAHPQRRDAPLPLRPPSELRASVGSATSGFPSASSPLRGSGRAGGEDSTSTKRKRRS